MTNSAVLVAELSDQGETGICGETLKVVCKNVGHGIVIKSEGYGDMTSEDGKGIVAIIEYYEGSLRLIAWSNINREDATHVIKFRDAREDGRDLGEYLDPETHIWFRKLSPKTEAEFRANARRVFKAGMTVDSVWHPVYRDECNKINAEGEKK